MYIDTHCHLEKAFYNNIDNVILDNRNADVLKIIVSGCNKDEILEVVNYALEYEDVYLTLGFHPDCATKVSDEDINWLRKILVENEKVIGVGEIGLDYHYGKEDKVLQLDLFAKQLKIAEELNLPVVIHSRDATEDTINMLKNFKVKGVIHCFSGSLETAKTYIKMGYYLGIGGVVTFKNSKLGTTLQSLSLDNIVLETDSPYLAPVPYRGSLNSSKNIPVIAEYIANLYDVSVQEVAEKTTENVKKIYGIYEPVKPGDVVLVRGRRKKGSRKYTNSRILVMEVFHYDGEDRHAPVLTVLEKYQPKEKEQK